MSLQLGAMAATRDMEQVKWKVKDWAACVLKGTRCAHLCVAVSVLGAVIASLAVLSYSAQLT